VHLSGAGRGSRGGAGKRGALPGAAAGKTMIAGDGGGQRDAVNSLAAKGKGHRHVPPLGAREGRLRRLSAARTGFLRRGRRADGEAQPPGTALQ
jgi:hypothetical protein